MSTTVKIAIAIGTGLIVAWIVKSATDGAPSFFVGPPGAAQGAAPNAPVIPVGATTGPRLATRTGQGHF